MKRRDKCKCGKDFYWDIGDGDPVICPHCKTEYEVNCEDYTVYWLVEYVDTVTPYQTLPK